MTREAFEHPQPETTELSDAECRRLLASSTLGRVGITSGALPVIVPVEYVYDDGVITFRTERDARLRAAEHGDVLAFEVDTFDAPAGRGWSVHVLGRATADETQHHYVRLHCEIVTGHRLVLSRV